MKHVSTTQRKYLRKLAHPLKPVVQIGKNGLTELVIQKTQQELNAHELIKVKFVDFQDQKGELARGVAEQSDSVLIGIIGNTAILYREHPDRDQRTIVLPER